MLEIENLRVEVHGKQILQGINLRIENGETHVLFGPNGSGKSSLAMTIMGFPQYKVVDGHIRFDGTEITGKSIDERAKLGIGIVLQKPPAVRGVKLIELVSYLGGTEELAERVNLPKELLYRDINVGFSGGEMKRAELMQVFAQNPKFLILDELDSGLDVENLETVGRIVNEFLRDRSGIIITHFGHILRHVEADTAHVLLGGKIVCSGPPSKILAQILKEGYRWCETCPLRS